MKNVLEFVGRGLLLASAALSIACSPTPDELSDTRAQDAPSSRGARTLRDVLRTAGPNEAISVIVTLADRVDIRAFTGERKQARRARIVSALQAQADRTQATLRALLQEGGATGVKPLWIINGVAATVTPALASRLLSFPGVELVALDSTMKAPATTPGVASAPEWNLTAVDVPAVWSLGFNGAGAVVANMDTGVDLKHVDLKSKWRGGADSWFDPYKHTVAPYDAIGHGTQTMGIMVGGAAGGTAIGVAPGAQWIAAKIYDDAGNTTVSVIHQAFQWLLAPSGVPGAPDAPDVVNASWGLSVVNGCDSTFQGDFEALRAAGIVVAFAGGNSGPSPSTSLSPANNVDGFSAGAVDATSAVADFSSRGPSACTGATFPDLVAPGVSVKTSDLSLGGFPLYAYVSGTSFSAPHVAGAAALLAGAFPAATAADLEQALRSTARDLGPLGPDNDYGYGLVDAYAAYTAIAAVTPLSIVTTALPNASPGVAYSRTLQAGGGGAPYTWSVTSGSLPAGLSLGAGTGSITGTPTATGTSSFVAQVEDTTATTATQALSINVVVSPLSITTAGLPSGHVGKPYSQTLAATGGVKPWAWSLAAGALPPGLKLGAATGTVSGTPTAKGAYSFTARVKDSNAASATKSLPIAVQIP